MITDNFEQIIVYLQKRRGKKHIRIDEYPDSKTLFCEYGQYEIWIGISVDGKPYDVNVQNILLADDQGRYGTECVSQEAVITFLKTTVKNIKINKKEGIIND